MQLLQIGPARPIETRRELSFSFLRRPAQMIQLAVKAVLKWQLAP